MVGHGGSSAGSYLADPTSPIPSHCASIVMTSTLRVNIPPGKGETVYYPALFVPLRVTHTNLTVMGVQGLFINVRGHGNFSS